MKVSTTKQFTPVTVVFETQEELNEFFAILNHTIIANCLPHIGGFNSLIEPYSTMDYRETHSRLDHITKTI